MYAQVPDILNALESVLKDFKANAIIEVTFRVAGTWLSELGGPPSVRLSVLPLSLLEKDIVPFELGFPSVTSYFSKLCNNLLQVLLLFKNGQPHIIELRKTVGLPPYKKYLFISAVKSPDLVLHTSTPSFDYFRSEFPANFRFIGSVVLPPKEGYQQPDWRQDIEQYEDKSNTPSI